MFTLVLLAVAQPPSIVPADPPAIVARVESLERRVAALESRSLPPGYIEPAARPAVYTQRVVLGSKPTTGPHTHGHTLADGTVHTWDHDTNATHNCQVPVLKRQRDGSYRYEPCGVESTTVGHASRVTTWHHAPFTIQGTPGDGPPALISLNQPGDLNQAYGLNYQFGSGTRSGCNALTGEGCSDGLGVRSGFRAPGQRLGLRLFGGVLLRGRR